MPVSRPNQNLSPRPALDQQMEVTGPKRLKALDAKRVRARVSFDRVLERPMTELEQAAAKAAADLARRRRSIATLGEAAARAAFYESLGLLLRSARNLPDVPPPLREPAP